MRFYSYFNTSIKILQLYDGSIPLSHFLKQYFAANKKHGSKDRRFITHACYCYFRLGHALKELNTEDRLKAAIFLCNKNADEWNVLFDEQWRRQWTESLNERIRFISSVYGFFSLKQVFPFTEQLSDGIDATTFIQSLFIQPDVFLRIRPHHHEHVIKTLHQNNVSFILDSDDCIRVPPNFNVEKFFKLDEEVVVQDYSSQQVKKYLQSVDSWEEHPTSNIRNPTSVWDCCAGSGGKSILAYDVLQHIALTATDIRPSIIHNLEKRFEKAKIKDYTAFTFDITEPVRKPISFVSGEGFDFIICDAPCTGSGTWGRSPEQLFFFRENKIDRYAELQRKVVANTISLLKPGGYFLYVTCSVFRKENEEIAAFIKSKFDLQLTKVEMLKGYDRKADTMFAVLFQS